ncbi:three-helix bundle dimerization domain-containing protein [Streptomyces sp. M-16]|uniref:three-helix bundle dimerization domain-containing protein n=1 Tax=Streptomyces sp. M-16 TaxID=3233040 RepID=UPI00225AAC2A
MAVRNLAARLKASYPTVDAVTVEAAVRAAYDSFHRARVRAYIPILVERRSRRALDAARRAAPDGPADGGGAIGPGPAKGW